MAKQPHRDKQAGAANAAHIAAYSQRILTLRRVLPIAAFLLLMLLVLAANPDLARAPQPNKLTSDDNDRLVIDRPVFQGRLPDGRRYELAALQGGQKINGDVSLSAARLAVAASQAHPSLSFSADKGLYRLSDDGMASLSGNVVVQTGDGRRISTAHLDMDMERASWQAPKGATMRAPSGDVTAQLIEADEAQGLYRSHKVKMRLHRRAKGAPQISPSPSAPSAPSAVRFTTDASAPIDLEAGLMVWQRGADRARFSAGARIAQGPLTLSAARIDIVLADDGTAQSLAADGQVILRSTNDAGRETRRAEADNALMDLTANTLVLRGDVTVVQPALTKDAQDRRVSGGQLTLDLVSGQARLTGGGDKPRARIELR
jgi:lipopolysaccharide transport protein LptA